MNPQKKESTQAECTQVRLCAHLGVWGQHVKPQHGRPGSLLLAGVGDDNHRQRGGLRGNRTEHNTDQQGAPPGMQQVPNPPPFRPNQQECTFIDCLKSWVTKINVHSIFVTQGLYRGEYVTDKKARQKDNNDTLQIVRVTLTYKALEQQCQTMSISVSQSVDRSCSCS